MTEQAAERVELGVEDPLLARPEAVPLARRAVAELAQRAGASPAVLDNVKLAVTEACANVVLHAYPDSGRMAVRAHARQGVLSVCIRDWGGGISGASDRAGLGLGLRLIESVCTSFESRDAGPGTEILMTFALRESS